ncbi:group II truncated hemoglobin [Erythrobacter sp. SG61-1L]|uniref:group II truncated hemoglobin n=1 Tax=Erythrobacter sp. SG61-1L TaxID=1603897 RepID=UPI0006C91A4E|nr:group II truncated hemoglobin [Erythrobacter sp. SG61-1L]
MAAAPEEPRVTAFERLGGAQAIGRIVERFYDLMECDPAYAELRAMHAPDLAPMRKSLAGFLTGWSGGPRDWFDANPGKCMMSMHSGFPIGAQTATQWAEAMQRAIADAELQDAEVAALLSERLDMIARSMGQTGKTAEGPAAA